MKKLNLLTSGVALGAFLLSTTALRAGILGSPHDFHGESWNVVGKDPNSVCGPCHQPHHADSSVVPLWGHQTTSTSPGDWTMYNTANVPVSIMKMSPATTPTGTSLACLSCHDGTVAVNSYGGKIQGGSAVTITNTANLGRDLTHTHPISFTYDDSLIGPGPTQDKWLYPSATAVLTPDSGTFVPGNVMTIAGFLLTKNSAGANRVECNSCHDVHNQIGTPFDLVTNPKLVKINGTAGGIGSLLCRSCHNK